MKCDVLGCGVAMKPNEWHIEATEVVPSKGRRNNICWISLEHNHTRKEILDTLRDFAKAFCNANNIS